MPGRQILLPDTKGYLLHTEETRSDVYKTVVFDAPGIRTGRVLSFKMS